MVCSNPLTIRGLTMLFECRKQHFACRGRGAVTETVFFKSDCCGANVCLSRTEKGDTSSWKAFPQGPRTVQGESKWPRRVNLPVSWQEWGVVYNSLQFICKLRALGGVTVCCFFSLPAVLLLLSTLSSLS